MLFFFELFLFVLVLLTLAIGELVSRGLALGLWLVITAFALVGYVLARGSLVALAREPGDAITPTAPADHAQAEAEEATPAAEHSPSGPTSGPTPMDARWARTLLYTWRRTNALLLLGALAVGGWYWLGG
jgi:hypothetical protein